MTASSICWLSLATVLLTGSAVAQDATDQHTPLSSGGMIPKEATGDFAASPPNAGVAHTNPDDSLATHKSTEESSERVWELWNLKPLSGSISIETILGSDDRTRNMVTTTYPERVIVLITSNEGRCSGTLVSNNTVLTAGHCVHGGGSSGTWSTGIRVYPGRNGPQSPYGSCSAKWLASVYGWTRDTDERYDYGAIKLDCNIGATTGWLGFFWQTASLVGLPTTIDGYPGDKPLEQWRSVDKLRVNDALQIFYMNDTVPGSSGSAVYTKDSTNCAGYCAMGVHAYGTHGGSPHGDHNHGIRITKDVYDNLLAWRSAQ